MDHSFRVAFWGLLAGFALSIALVATDPQEIRLALDTPPPVDLDTLDTATMLADAGPSADAPASDAAAEPPFIDALPINDNRLAMDPERPLLVPPFDSVSRPVPSPPDERPIIDVDDSNNAGVPIELEMDGDQPRIHVVIRPSEPREFVELPPPPLLEETQPPRSIAHGPTLPPLTGQPFVPPTSTLAIPSDQSSIDETSVEIDEPPPAAAHEPPPGPPAVTAEAIDELKSMFADELASLRAEIQSSASSHELNDRLADILEAQQQLDRDRVIHEIALLRSDLEQLREEEEEQIQAAVEADENAPPPTVVITPSSHQPGRIDVELNAAPAAEAFAVLGREAGQNVLTSSEIEGNVTARLQGVIPWEAVLALAHSRDCQVTNDGGYLVVVPSSHLDESTTSDRYSQVLFPKHLAAEEVAAMLQPLLTPGVGQISCTSGHSEHSLARTQAVLIVDCLAVIEQARSVLSGIDCPPQTLQITAQIMLVRREGFFRNGVLAALQNGQGVLPPGVMPQAASQDFGCCDSVAVAMPQHELCQRLRQFADVELVATPSVHVLDRHTAEIAITDDSCREGLWIRPGPRMTDVAGESSLAVRPTIAGQGMIHLEVSPGGCVETHNRRGSQETSGRLATSVLIPNGGSVVIGEVYQDATANRHPGAEMLGSLRRFLPGHAAGVNSSVEFVVVISACIVQ